MATINLGRVKLVNRGTWSSANTYAIDDFVQFTDNGVVSTYIAVAASTNQTPSTSGTENSNFWKFLAKGVSIAVGNNKIVTSDASGNLQGTSIGSAGQFLRTNSGANGFEFGDVTSAIRKITMFNDATYNISISSTSSATYPISFDFVKAQADSDLFIQGWTPASEQSSFRVGERMKVTKVSGGAEDSGADTEVFGGNNWLSPEAGANSDGIKGMMMWSRRVDTSSETFFNSAETYRVHLGYHGRNSNATRPGVKWNPQNTSSRDRQSTTNVWVWELDPSTTAFVT
tara:strand:+ start:38 stop:895 length:858 start_codon:yes stop_codon:yes gene_type:complete